MPKIVITERRAQILSCLTQGKNPDAPSEQWKNKAKATKVKGQKKETQVKVSSEMPNCWSNVRRTSALIAWRIRSGSIHTPSESVQVGFKKVPLSTTIGITGTPSTLIVG
ncbi:MAG: hypothetical protein OXQ89_10330 [Rhodospirillaceae bacterium]|nr:hypothetical protein [Rhodospirillaceae bacterium]